jgi:decaprenylphospho-beta-D-erythro-pentofuranosid-2-ulose 2-reductase
MKRVLIVGATSKIAECCARRWAAGGAKLFLVARDAARLERIAADLGVRGGSPQSISGCTFDALDYEGYPRLVEQAAAFLGGIDIALIAHGTLPEQERCQHELAETRKALEVNGVSPALLAEACAMHMAPAGGGAIAVIGSVAGDRGRKSNYAYGAAKGLVHRYMEGMRHRLAPLGLQIVTIKPGPTDTPMTANYRQAGVRLADPDDVAQRIVDGIARGRTTIYAPGVWRWIMLVIRHIPEPIFRRLPL